MKTLVKKHSRTKARVGSYSATALLIASGGSIAQQAIAQTTPTLPLSVMTFNIRYGTAPDGLDHWILRKPRTILALNEHKPELIGLQEALSFQIDDLLTSMPGYQAVGVGRDDGRCAGEYSAIMYDSTRLQVLRSDTFWLSETPEVPASRHWGNDCVRVCTWAYFKDLKTGKFFYQFNTHMDHKSQYSREKGIQLILSRIKNREPKDPVLLTGDLNTSESNPVIPLVLRSGLRDTFRTIHPDAIDVGTTNAFKETTEPNKIDYIFVDENWGIKDAEILHDKVDGRWISDHLPVTALITLK